MKIEVTKTNLILAAIAVILLGYILITRNFSKTVVDNSAYVHKIDSLNSVILDYRTKQLDLDKKIASYELDIKRLDFQIDSAENKIIEIRHYYDKKIKDISRYSASELDDFFSKRYK
jgi:predicted  nucleic acid-binding Zn-ribbon protein